MPRAGLFHQPTRQRERQMRRFKSPDHTNDFSLLISKYRMPMALLASSRHLTAWVCNIKLCIFYSCSLTIIAFITMQHNTGQAVQPAPAGTCATYQRRCPEETVLYQIELFRRLHQAYLDQRSTEEPIKERVMGAAGVARTHRRESCKRDLETRFGEVTVSRRGYGARGLESVFPLDAELNLPPDKYSHGLREQLAEEVVGGSFDEAIAHLERAGGGRMAKRQAEEVAIELSQDFDGFYSQPFESVKDERHEDKILIITADGKGIVMHPDSLREATRKAAEKEKRKQQTTSVRVKKTTASAWQRWFRSTRLTPIHGRRRRYSIRIKNPIRNDLDPAANGRGRVLRQISKR